MVGGIIYIGGTFILFTAYLKAQKLNQIFIVAIKTMVHFMWVSMAKSK